MTQAYAQILQSVQVVRRTWQNRRAMEGSLLTMAAPLTVLAFAALLDRYAHFAPAGQWILALLVYGAALLMLRAFVLRPLLTRHTDDFFAAMIEARQPALRNRLINALQLGRQPALGAAPKLVDAVVADGFIVAAEPLRDLAERGGIAHFRDQHLPHAIHHLGTAIQAAGLLRSFFGLILRPGRLLLRFRFAGHQ